jgi:hypothetical protein
MVSSNGTFSTLSPSTHDTVALVDAVCDRLGQLAALYLRVRGMQLTFPQSMRSDVALWRTVLIRHQAGDFRNSGPELTATKTIAQWAVNLKMSLCGQRPKAIEWR